ncbi:AAA family ATPase [Aggregatibacter actinomycetemcomitans]|uniref:AAA family ATPase n=1 Tax=Aggregatibacter actinomycetemcomitans TaxID=714 RepID=UPI001E3C03F1|nr:AAA family ATPase [Aggregatibacter actinomycetemcomitans]
MTLIELPLPDQSQIQVVLNTENIANELTDRLSTALSGLNELDIQQLLRLLKNKYGELKAENEKAILAEIQQQKEQIIAKSGVLEMVKVNEAIDDIGGLEKLKAWLQDQSYIVKNLQAAKEFGVKAPKGTLIAGMPGCGKSLTAKAAAALFQQPLLRLDIGSLLGKYVGESETNMRKALAMAEIISPCVLWVDELEKAFVGMSGNNASEVSSRLLGYFLTWLQEKIAPVFIIATANDITALPPELLRKGRFDEIFYVGFPTKKERKKIIEIHLAKAKQKASEFDIDALANECRDYAGADIENAIFDAVKNAFISNDKILTQDLLLEAIRKTTPLRKTLKDKVGEYEKKFDELYLSSASENDDLSITQLIKMAENTSYLERLRVAKNEDATEEILEKLAKDENLEVRKAVFSNPNCPSSLINWKLQLDIKDKDYDDILLILLDNPNVSFDLVLDIIINKYDYNINRTIEILRENKKIKREQILLMNSRNEVMHYIVLSSRYFSLEKCLLCDSFLELKKIFKESLDCLRILLDSEPNISSLSEGYKSKELVFFEKNILSTALLILFESNKEKLYKELFDSYIDKFIESTESTYPNSIGDLQILKFIEPDRYKKIINFYTPLDGYIRNKIITNYTTLILAAYIISSDYNEILMRYIFEYQRITPQIASLIIGKHNNLCVESKNILKENTKVTFSIFDKVELSKLDPYFKDDSYINTSDKTL